MRPVTAEELLTEDDRVENIVQMELRGELQNTRGGRRNLAGVLAREIINQRNREKRLHDEIGSLKHQLHEATFGTFRSIFSF